MPLLINSFVGWGMQRKTSIYWTYFLIFMYFNFVKTSRALDASFCIGWKKILSLHSFVHSERISILLPIATATVCISEGLYRATANGDAAISFTTAPTFHAASSSFDWQSALMNNPLRRKSFTRWCILYSLCSFTLTFGTVIIATKRTGISNFREKEKLNGYETASMEDFQHTGTADRL